MPPSSPPTPPDADDSERASLPEVPAAPRTKGRGAPERESRAFRWGLGVSVAFHLLALLLYPLIMERITPEATPPTAPTPEVVERGMEVVAFREIPDELDPEEEEPDEVPEDPVVPTPVAPPAADVPAEDPVDVEVAEPEMDDEDRRHIAERLQPQPGDPRLWAPLDQDYMDLSDEERAQLMLRGMLQDWNDSMAVAAALSDAARDWTYTDEEGRRWGLSPGRLHLGDFSVPLPFTFDTPPGLRDRARDRQWILEDLARGAASQAIRETWAERAREIRRRMDEERNRERGEGRP